MFLTFQESHIWLFHQENLQKQLTDLKKEMSAMKKSGGRNKQVQTL